MGVLSMTPDIILDRLKRNNMKISRKTLYNWEKYEVINEATFRNSRTADYPDSTFNEVYANYMFTLEGIYVPLFDFNIKIGIDAVIKIRKVYLKITRVAEEMKLNPWVSQEDLKKVVLNVFGGDKSKILAFNLLGLEDNFYWLTQYHFYLQKANTVL